MAHYLSAQPQLEILVQSRLKSGYILLRATIVLPHPTQPKDNVKIITSVHQKDLNIIELLSLHTEATSGLWHIAHTSPIGHASAEHLACGLSQVCMPLVQDAVAAATVKLDL